ncbi:hypothetical protein B7Y94_06165, partial [Candidatus Saccharibacteria bacterium 32-49-12]
MKISTGAKYQKLTSLTAALVLAMSSMTALGSFVLFKEASALSGVAVYEGDWTNKSSNDGVTHNLEPTLDTVAPAITINGAVRAKSSYGEGVVRIQVAEANYSHTVIEQKNEAGVYEHRFTYQAHKGQSFKIEWLGNGEYRVQAFDLSGNASNRLVFAIDTEDPYTTLVTPPAGATVGGLIKANGQATDNIALSRVYLQLVNRENNNRYGGKTIHLSGKSADWSHAFDANALSLPEGTYAVHVSATDRAGNTYDSGWSNNFKMEKTAPVFEITNLEDGDLVATAKFEKLVVKGTLTDSSGAYAHLQLVKDGHSRGIVTVHAPVVNGVLAEFSTKDLETGDYELFYTVTDYLGNAHSRQKIDITIDSKFAEVSLTSPSNGQVVSGEHEFIVTSDEDISKWLFSLNGKAYGSLLQRIGDSNEWSVIIDTTTLPDGEHKVSLRATDLAGNTRYWNNRGNLHSFIVDNQGPEIDFTLTGRTVFGSTSELGQDVTISIGAFGPYVVTPIDGNWTFVLPEEIPAGVYDVSVYSQDPYGNETETTKSQSVSSLQSSSSAGDPEEGEVLSGVSIDNQPLIATNSVQTLAFASPSITSPTEVLGETTESVESEDAAVAGASSTRNIAQAADTEAVTDDENRGVLWGLAWYWWL